MKTLFITFGCSWTYGVGVGYQSGMTLEEYKAISWDPQICNQYSFRGLLSSKYNLTNINFALGGSSNQTQFRLAKEFFISKEFNELKTEYSKIIVFHAITSITRNEMFNLEKKLMQPFFYSVSHYDPAITDISKAIMKYSYCPLNIVEQLANEMLFWNMFYKANNISNLWVDTFNHHDYLKQIPNMIGMEENPRDLLSKLALDHNIAEVDNLYHASSWQIDTNRLEPLIKQELINPISLHPTKKGHAEIAYSISNPLEQIL
jgi:hypothetical protein